MNEACPAQQHETACARSDLFERRRRRMDDRAAVSFPIHARFHSFQLPSSPRQARQPSAIYLTAIINSQSRTLSSAGSGNHFRFASQSGERVDVKKIDSV